jgi:chemotaxis protein CheD
MNLVNVGIGEYAVSSNPGDQLKTYALGSCVAIVVYDKDLKLAALMHVALPDSDVNSEKAARSPGYFADTGVVQILRELRDRSARRKSISIKLIGGSNIMDQNRHFDIGKRNVLAIKKLLWKYQLGVIAEDTGGDISRTVTVTVATGTVNISSGRNKWEL